MSLFVVYLPDTGHVAGAVSATGAVVPVEPTALVGDALPLRVPAGDGETATLPLPSRELLVLLADDEPAVFTDPLAFGVEQVPDAPPKSALVRLAAWSDELRFDAAGLVVRVPVANTTRTTPVFALVSGGQDVHVLAGEIAIGEDQVTLPLTVAAGSTHGVLVLATGWAGRLATVTAP
ncbi:hypothetical protein [Actinophytocola sediminis]